MIKSEASGDPLNRRGSPLKGVDEYNIANSQLWMEFRYSYAPVPWSFNLSVSVPFVCFFMCSIPTMKQCHRRFKHMPSKHMERPCRNLRKEMHIIDQPINVTSTPLHSCFYETLMAKETSNEIVFLHKLLSMTFNNLHSDDTWTRKTLKHK